MDNVTGYGSEFGDAQSRGHGHRYGLRMAKTQAVELPGSNFSQVLDVAAKLPGVRINGVAYFRVALKRHCTMDQIARAIAQSPAAAAIPFKIYTVVPDTSIACETSKVTGISTLAGRPGGMAMIGTVHADMVQYIRHMLRIAQSLTYVYGFQRTRASDGTIHQSESPGGTWRGTLNVEVRI